MDFEPALEAGDFGEGLRPTWRPDLDALHFTLPDGKVEGLVHRLAFRNLLRQAPTPEACRRYFLEHQVAFAAAASEKIRRNALSEGARLHLTSRDVKRADKGAKP